MSRSALIRFVRTLFQAGLAWLTVDRLEVWVAGADWSADVKTLAVGFGTAVLAFAHRRILDPSPVPSLVDRHRLTGVPER